MTTEEKLQHFYDVAVGEAKAEADAMIEKHKQQLDSDFEDYKKFKEQEFEGQLKAETANAQREINKALSAEQLAIKKKWSRRQSELKEKLFVEVKTKLEDFMSSPAYEDYLCQKIMEAKEFAGSDNMTVYITSADTEHLSSLAAKTGIAPTVSKESFMGGIKAIIPEKNILIDHSFEQAYYSIKKNFTFDGGLSDE